MKNQLYNLLIVRIQQQWQQEKNFTYWLSLRNDMYVLLMSRINFLFLSEEKNEWRGEGYLNGSIDITNSWTFKQDVAIVRYYQIYTN